jgi:hypothetical protein
MNKVLKFFLDISTTRPKSIQSWPGRLLWDIGAWMCLRACRIDARTLWLPENGTIRSILDEAANRERDLFPLQTAYKWHPILLQTSGLLPPKLAHSRLRGVRNVILSDLGTMKLPPEVEQCVRSYCESSQSLERALMNHFLMPNVKVEARGS